MRSIARMQDVSSETKDNIFKLLKANPRLTAREVLIRLLQMFIAKQTKVDVGKMSSTLFKAKHPNLFFAKKLLAFVEAPDVQADIAANTQIFPRTRIRPLLFLIPKNSDILKLLQIFFSIYTFDAAELTDVIREHFDLKDIWGEDISNRIQDIYQANENCTLGEQLSLLRKLGLFVDWIPSDRYELIRDVILRLIYLLVDDDTDIELNANAREAIINDIVGLGAWLPLTMREEILNAVFLKLVGCANSSINELACDLAIRIKNWQSQEGTHFLQENLRTLLRKAQSNSRPAIEVAARGAKCLAEFMPDHERLSLIHHFAETVNSEHAIMRQAAIEGLGRLKFHMFGVEVENFIRSIRTNLNYENIFLCIAACETLSHLHLFISKEQKELIVQEIFKLLINESGDDEIIDKTIIESVHSVAFITLYWLRESLPQSDKDIIIEQLVNIILSESESEEYKITALQYLAEFKGIIANENLSQVIRQIMFIIHSQTANVNIKAEAIKTILKLVPIASYHDKLSIFEELDRMSDGAPIQLKMAIYEVLKTIKWDIPQEAVKMLSQSLFRDMSTDFMAFAASKVSISDLSSLLDKGQCQIFLKNMLSVIVDEAKPVDMRKHACIFFTELCTLEYADAVDWIEAIMKAFLTQMTSGTSSRIAACQLLEHLQLPLAAQHYQQVFDVLMKHIDDNQADMRAAVYRALIFYIPNFNDTERITALCCLRSSCHHRELLNGGLDIAMVNLYSSVYRKEAVISILNRFIPVELSTQIINYRI